MDVSKEIVKVREAKRIKQSEVAEKLNMERPNYSRIEKRGLKMSLEQLIQIADVLEVPFMDLLKDSDNPIINPEFSEIKKENKELKGKIADLEDDKKLLKKELLQIQSQFEEVYLKNAFSTILPFIFKEFLEILRTNNSKEYSTDLYKLFEKLISFDRDSQNTIYIFDKWEVENCYITKLIDYDWFLNKILKGFFDETIISEYLVLFQKEYSNFSDKYIQNEYEEFEKEINQSRTR